MGHECGIGGLRQWIFRVDDVGDVGGQGREGRVGLCC
jgi:hypothetical protein